MAKGEKIHSLDPLLATMRLDPLLPSEQPKFFKAKLTIEFK